MLTDKSSLWIAVVETCPRSEWHTDRTSSGSVEGTMTDRWWTVLAAVLVMSAWICQHRSSVDAAALRHGRHRGGSRRSRADPDRPVTELSIQRLSTVNLFYNAAASMIIAETPRDVRQLSSDVLTLTSLSLNLTCDLDSLIYWHYYNAPTLANHKLICATELIRSNERYLYYHT